jgi:hypothetical protein
MRLVIIALMLIFAINALAAPATLTMTQKPSVFQAPRTVRAMLSYGSELRTEKDIDSNLTPKNLTNYAVGVGYKSWLAIFEKASFEESSGNATLNLKRTLDDMMLWGQYRITSWKYMAPYVGLGAGYYKNKVETSLMGDTTTNSSKNRFLTGGNIGLSLDVPYVWLSVEARMLFGEDLDRQPTMGGLFRAGLYF